MVTLVYKILKLFASLFLLTPMFSIEPKFCSMAYKTEASKCVHTIHPFPLLGEEVKALLYICA